jgi:hypothetical protein
MGIEVEYNGRFYRADGELDYSTMFSTLGLDVDSAAWARGVDYTAISINSFIPSGHTVSLLTLRHVREHASRQSFEQLVRQLDPLICYASVYGDRFYATPISGKTDARSCRFDGTMTVFGRRFRLKNPLAPPLNSEAATGLPP